MAVYINGEPGNEFAFITIPQIRGDIFEVADIAERDALIIGVNDGEVSNGDIVIVNDADGAGNTIRYMWDGTVYKPLNNSASSIQYDNASSGLSSTNINAAIDEVSAATGIPKEGSVVIQVYGGITELVVGDGASYFTIPSTFDGFDLVSVHARVVTAPVGSAVTVQIHNVTNAVDVLSTPITIDDGTTGSDTAAVPAVIDVTANNVVTNDLIRIDIDTVGITTPAKGLIVRLEFKLP